MTTSTPGIGTSYGSDITDSITDIERSTIRNVTGNFTGNVTGYGLTEEEIIYYLRPSLHYFTTYAYILWYAIGLPANTVAFLVWIQRKVRFIGSSSCKPHY